MRSYPTDSPQAVARIVALALLSDGNLHPRELGALERVRSHADQLPGEVVRQVLREFCEDLMASAAAPPAHMFQLDHGLLVQLLAEVQDENLRIRVLQLCVAVVEADSHLARGEYEVLHAAARHWRVSVDRLDLFRALDAAHA